MNDDTALPPLAPLPSHDEIARKIANRWADRKAAAGGQKPDGCPMDNNANGDTKWFRLDLLDPENPMDATIIRAHKEYEEWLTTGTNATMEREKTLAEHRAEWAAIRARNVAAGRTATPPASKAPPDEDGGAAWLDRNKWIVVAVIAAIAIVTVAYLMRPSRYRAMGEHNRMILDSKTGEVFYPNGKRVK